MNQTRLRLFDTEAVDLEELPTRCCPWCLAPPEEMRPARGSSHRPACGRCGAIQPVDEAWYQRGELVSI